MTHVSFAAPAFSTTKKCFSSDMRNRAGKTSKKLRENRASIVLLAAQFRVKSRLLGCVLDCDYFSFHHFLIRNGY
jgi:hypothetical protein